MSLKADPDWRFAHQVACFLESHAHLAVRESQAHRALAHAEHWRPDLVILAAELLDGNDQLIDSLRKIKPRPALLLTGWLDRYDRLWRAWQNGGDELLIKPVLKSQELFQAIVTALENAAAGTRTRHALAASA